MLKNITMIIYGQASKSKKDIIIKNNDRFQDNKTILIRYTLSEK